MEKEKKDVFSILSAINVNDKAEKKKDATYLSWANAWGELMKVYPNASYEVVQYPMLGATRTISTDGEITETFAPVADVTVPYLVTPEGLIVTTKVTIEGTTREMSLPVMDSSNRAMKDKPYSYKINTYKGEQTISVAAATMFDINKAILRCLVKNIALFGLGLYIYANEDLPDPEKEAKAEAEAKAKAEAEAKAKAEAEAKIKKEAEASGFKTPDEARDAYAKLVDQPAEAVDAACKKFLDGKNETEIIAYFAGLIKKTEAKRKNT